MIHTPILLMPVIASLLALTCAAMALRNNSRKRLIQSLPTSKTDGVFIGLVELNGTAESARPLHSYLAETPCVHYDWQVEERWSRTRTVTDGKGRTSTRHEQGWKTVASGGETQRFYLRDSAGAVLVSPQEAKLQPATFIEHTCGPEDALYYAKGPMEAISHSDMKRRFTERGFALHQPVFIVGRARERSDTVAAEIAHDEAAEMFIISTKGEEKVVSGYRWAGIAWGVVGLAVLVLMLVWWDKVQRMPPRVEVYTGAVLAYTFCLMLGWVWSVYNALIGLRNRVLQGLSLIDIQLQRRHDLIPNLVRAVTALARHEQGVQAEVTTLRTQANATLPGQPGPDPQALKPVLVVLQETYPELKTNPVFLDLQRELASTENRIALARDYFNSIATHYNTCLEQFPDSAVAALARLKAQPLLAAAGFERAVVQVQFAR